ncbi:hypothetical protein [Polaribacter sp. KT25b]|uniref:hypothetical protein n=1 Tax=Polaribacter sp. KT25b TaxID=1855336 RepID=UPI000B04D692|nr:hypothetical protein [Polaribacter sp. KT25b]
MKAKTIKCPNCGTLNTGKKYCTNCNKSLTQEILLQEKLEKIKQQEINKVIYKRENPNFIERLKKHSFFLYRIFGWILYSGFVVVSAIGAGLAWFIAMVAAG